MLHVCCACADVCERYQRNPDMNVEFMPEYLRNFLMANVSAQTMFDRGRLEAVQARVNRALTEP
jgi:hypothetical protein